jgi:hypothetical protein
VSGGQVVRQKRTARRSRFIPVLAACGAGYVIGAWHVTALRSAGQSSAAETVALRFPHEWTVAAPPITLAGMRASRPETDLLSPSPMVVPSQLQSAAMQPAAETSATASAGAGLTQTASLENSPIAAAVEGSAARPANRAAAKPAVGRPAAASRASYVLDNAQIASIKQRLHLTPEQEQMWPAVEAALRNMKRSQEAAARGTPRSAQAAVDPEAVQGLKSAAVPLIMSFSAEQKEEVRSLAHVMGLDQFATQF